MDHRMEHWMDNRMEHWMDSPKNRDQRGAALVANGVDAMLHESRMNECSRPERECGIKHRHVKDD